MKHAHDEPGHDGKSGTRKNVYDLGLVFSGS